MKNQNTNHLEKRSVEKKETFFQELLRIPDALKEKVLTYIIITVLIALFCVILMVVSGNLKCAVILLLALYTAYSGLDIVWAYSSGKLIQKKMVCFKQAKHPFLNCLEVICQEADEKIMSEETIHKFYIQNSRKNKHLFSPNTVLNIFYRTDNQTEIVAWKIVGYLSGD